MRYKTNNKAVMHGYTHVIKIGYCEAQHLLRYSAPIAYTESGAYGWKSDIYHFGDIAISTGYAPVGDICPSYEFVKEYDEKAFNAGWDNVLVKKLLDEFIDRCVKGEAK